MRLHVTNGDSAADSLRRTALGGGVLAWNDVLNEGPVPALPPRELRRVRARFLGTCGWGSARSILQSLERRDELLAHALADRRHVVLWFEHDLFDQLQLLQVLAFVADADQAHVELLEAGTFEGRIDFRGLGELTADEPESLWGKQRPVTAELAGLGRLAWDALRAPDPTALAALLESDTTALPFLGGAVRRLLEELPDTDGGLSRGERQALDLLAAGPAAPRQLFLESPKREEAPFEGDAWLWRRLSELGSGERPLVVRADGRGVGLPPPLADAQEFAAAPLALTDDGRSVLEGEADRVDLLGIDRWIGGTQLEPGRVWRRDRSTGVIAPE